MRRRRDVAALRFLSHTQTTWHKVLGGKYIQSACLCTAQRQEGGRDLVWSSDVNKKEEVTLTTSSLAQRYRGKELKS